MSFFDQNAIINVVQLKLDDRLAGCFMIEEEGKRSAEMKIRIQDNTIEVYDAELFLSQQREELRLLLFLAMISYAREHYLHVIAVGLSVHHRLSHDADQYTDIWDQNG